MAPRAFAESELDRLRLENKLLREENAQLRALTDRIPKLIARIDELEKKLAEALRAQRRQAAPFSKGPPKEHPEPRGRKPGPDYGTKAYRPIPDRTDEIIPVALPDSCVCGGRIRYDHTAQQFQVEIPKKPIHRRFDIEVGYCRYCGKRVQGRHPLQTSDAVGAAASQLGPDAQAMTALLKNKAGVSYGDVQAIFKDFFGISLSPGGAAQAVLRVARRAEAAYRGIGEVISRSRLLYPDETGWKVGGWLQWLWVFVGRTATFFVIRPSRGHDVLVQVLGARWSGRITHDGWSAYEFLKRAHHQQCLGHLIRRAKELLETATGAARRFPQAVLDLLGSSLALRDRRDAGVLSPHGLAVVKGRLEARLGRLLAPLPRQPLNRLFAKHLRNHERQLLPFLAFPGLEPTSCQADQAIRPAVVNRKVFGGNRDPSGARAQEILSSIVATARQRRIPIFEYLSRILRAPPDDRGKLACRLLHVPLTPP
jgi:transposase